MEGRQWSRVEGNGLEWNGMEWSEPMEAMKQAMTNANVCQDSIQHDTTDDRRHTTDGKGKDAKAMLCWNAKCRGVGTGRG
jgi:hypothetical protein